MRKPWTDTEVKYGFHVDTKLDDKQKDPLPEGCRWISHLRPYEYSMDERLSDTIPWDG